MLRPNLGSVRLPILIGVLALVAVVVVGGWFFLAPYGRPTSSPGGTAQRIGLSVGALNLSSTGAATAARYPVTYAIQGLEAVDIQFCYLNATGAATTLPFNASVIDSAGAVVSTYSSTNATECISPSTGLSASLLNAGGWVSGGNQSVIAGDTLSIGVVSGAREVWMSYWTPEASLLTTLQV
jgi:hypothetical protein